MIWSVLLFSQYKNNKWIHTPSTSLFKMFVKLSKRKILIYSQYLGEEEDIFYILLFNISLRCQLDSVGIFYLEEKIQVKLTDSTAALDLYSKTVYIQQIIYLKDNLREIRKLHKKEQEWE